MIAAEREGALGGSAVFCSPSLVCLFLGDEGASLPALDPRAPKFLSLCIPRFWVALGPGKECSWKVLCQQPALWLIPADSTGQGTEENKSMLAINACWRNTYINQMWA